MEDYVSYEQAVKLKQLGFDWKVTHFYVEKSNYRNKPYLKCNGEYLEMLGGLGGSVLIEDLIKDNNNVNDDFSAPTLAQAQKWLREKEIEVGVFANFDGELSTGKWVWLMRKFNTHLYATVFPEDINYDTYEDALSAGIDAAIEQLLKEK